MSRKKHYSCAAPAWKTSATLSGQELLCHFLAYLAGRPGSATFIVALACRPAALVPPEVPTGMAAPECDMYGVRRSVFELLAGPLCMRELPRLSRSVRETGRGEVAAKIQQNVAWQDPKFQTQLENANKASVWTLLIHCLKSVHLKKYALQEYSSK